MGESQQVHVCEPSFWEQIVMTAREQMPLALFHYFALCKWLLRCAFEQAGYLKRNMWPCMRKPTIHRKTSISSFLHHPLTEPLLITMMFSFFPYDLLFSSYTTVSVIQMKMYISRNVRFQFRIHAPFTNSQRSTRFIFDKYIHNLWTKLCQKVRSRGHM